MKKKTIALCGALLGGFLAFGGGALSLGGYSPREKTFAVVNAEEIGIELGCELMESYMCGTKFTIPSAELDYNGTKKKAESAVLVFPNGTAYEAQAGELILDEAGKYTLVYAASFSGKKVEKHLDFQATKAVYEVGYENSEIATTDNLPMFPATATPGISVTLAAGDTFVYNKPIDLSASETEMDFITIFPYGNTAQANYGDGYTVEVDSLVVRLTDCYDENRYVDFYIDYKQSGTDKVTGLAIYNPYYNVKAVGQSFATGFVESAETAASATRPEVFVNDIRYLARTDGTYGKTGGNVKRNFDDCGVTFGYDMKTQIAYSKDLQRYPSTSSPVLGDLDNSELYGEKTFGGFTTGEVYLSVRGEGYRNGVVETRFDISNLGGEIPQATADQGYKDEIKPTVTVFADVAGKEFKIAKGEEFTLFDATADDINLIGNVKAEVYYGYGTGMQSRVGVKDGKFKPNKVGLYTIRYTATDVAGNVGEALVSLNCIDAGDRKGITFSTEKLTSLQAGEQIALPAYTVIGLNGEVKVDVKAIHNATGEITEIDSQTLAFTPTALGEYTIVYDYTDGLKAYSYSYTLTSISSNSVVLAKPMTFPEYFIKGARYAFEEAYVYTYENNERVENLATIFIQEDGGEWKEATYGEYRVNASSTVRFKLQYDGEDVAESTSKAFSVIDVGSFNNLTVGQGAQIESTLGRFFVGDFEPVVLGEGVRYTSNKTSGDNGLTFINVLSLANFTFEFLFENELMGFGAVEIEIIDYYDRENKTSITYEQSGKGYLLGYNGTKTFLNSELTARKNTISYVNGTFTVIGNTTRYYAANDYSSDKVLLHVTFKDITGAAGLQISKLGSQLFNNGIIKDNGQPMLTVQDVAGYYGYNDVLTVYAATALDVLSPFLPSRLGVSVTTPSGKAAVSMDNVTMLFRPSEGHTGTYANRDYQIELNEYGTWEVVYVATDQSGIAQLKRTFKITVQDNVAPTITMESGYTENTVKTAKVGDTVTIADCNASDNVSVADKLLVWAVVYSPDNSLIFPINGKFVAKEQGEWIIHYYVSDEAGNYSTYSYIVRVE